MDANGGTSSVDSATPGEAQRSVTGFSTQFPPSFIRVPSSLFAVRLNHGPQPEAVRTSERDSVDVEAFRSWPHVFRSPVRSVRTSVYDCANVCEAGTVEHEGDAETSCQPETTSLKATQFADPVPMVLCASDALSVYQLTLRSLPQLERSPVRCCRVLVRVWLTHWQDGTLDADGLQEPYDHAWGSSKLDQVSVETDDVLSTL